MVQQGLNTHLSIDYISYSQIGQKKSTTGKSVLSNCLSN